MPPAGFEPTIPASEWVQTHTLDRAATGIGVSPVQRLEFQVLNVTLSSFAMRDVQWRSALLFTNAWLNSSSL